MQVLFGGGPADQAALEPARQAGFPASAGAPLLVTAGLMKLSTLILGGDTGLLHLAVAMDKRVVMIMDSTGPGSAYPFQHPDWAVTPANGQSVAAITTDAVNEACGRAFAELGVRGARVSLDTLARSCPIAGRELDAEFIVSARVSCPRTHTARGSGH